MANFITAVADKYGSAFYYLKKKFTARAGASMRARALGATRYQIFINGKRVCEGPCTGPIHTRFYDEMVLDGYLREGENEIFVKLLHVTREQFLVTAHDDTPLFCFDGTLLEGGEITKIETDESWEFLRDDSVGFFYSAGVMTTVAPFEEHFEKKALTPLPVREIKGVNERSIYGIIENATKKSVKPRPIPEMHEGEPKQFIKIADGENFIELDAGEYTTAKVRLTVNIPKGKTLGIIYAECYMIPLDTYHGKKFRRDKKCTEDSVIFGRHDIIHGTGEPFVLDTFWYRAFRFIRLECDGEFELIEATYRPYYYPLSSEGSFECNDPKMNKMWDIGRSTLLSCMHELIVDCPYYEQQQYCMDSALETLFSMRYSRDVRLVKKAILDLAESQIECGMLQANYPSRSRQIIPNFSLFWIFMLENYILYSADTSILKKLGGTVDKILSAFDERLTERGLISEMTEYWHFVDWVPEWKNGVPIGGYDEPMCVDSLMYAAALESASKIFAMNKNYHRHDEYLERRAEVISAAKEAFFDESRGMFKDTESADNFSQHTAVWAVISGAVTGDGATALMEKAMTESISKCTFSFGFYLFRALEIAGLYDKYASTLLDGWREMIDLGCTTWAEKPNDSRSECHGWSATPTYELSAIVLGVKPTSAGFRTVSIEPHTEAFGISEASGRVPTPYGEITVGWRITEGGFNARVTLPDEGMRATLKIGGEVYEIAGREAFEITK